MSLIALFNLAKDYLKQRHTDALFKQLDQHTLRDIGFYRENGHIRRLSGELEEQEPKRESVKAPPAKLPLDG